MSAVAPKRGMGDFPQIVLRAAGYMGHVYLGEELWSYLLFDGMSLLVRQPEETVSQPMHHRTSRSFSDSVHLPSPHGAILVDSPCTLPDIFRTPGSLIRFVPPEPVPVSPRLALRVHRVTAPPCLPDPPALTSPTACPGSASADLPPPQSATHHRWWSIACTELREEFGRADRGC